MARARSHYPPGSTRRAAPEAKDVAPLFEKYCLNCHDAADAQGGVMLENVSDASGEKLKPLLIRVAENLRSQSMPPEGEPQPDAAELETICAWIDGVAGKADRPAGRRVARRLNRAQYNNTIRDLIGLDLRPADEFPSDDVGYGFDNIGEVLSISPVLLEMYLGAAEKVIDAAFAVARATKKDHESIRRCHAACLSPIQAPCANAAREQGASKPVRPRSIRSCSASRRSTTSCAHSQTGLTGGRRRTTSSRGCSVS